MMARRVLMIDDDPAFREMVSEALADRWPDMEIDQARDGYVGERKLQAGRYDLILLDYRLPFGMSGLRFLERTRELREGTPLVMITGEGNEEVAARAFKLGATDYLVKRPSLISTLVRVVEDIFAHDGEEQARKSANLVSAESGIELIRSYQSELAMPGPEMPEQAEPEEDGEDGPDMPGPGGQVPSLEFMSREEMASAAKLDMEDAILVEFEDPDEFNRFSGFIKRMDGVKLREVRVLDGKFVMLLSLLPGRFERMGRVLAT